MVVYLKDLEVRVDKLERERNTIKVKSEKLARTTARLKTQNQKMKNVLRALYNAKNPKVMDLLIKTDALLLLGSSDGLGYQTEDEDEEQEEEDQPKDRYVNSIHAH